MTNLERHKAILNEITKHFTITNKDYMDGYFIFDFGKDSVCHFTLKETPDWDYGIWQGDTSDDPEEKYNFKIFGEHSELIDKFKPSRTYVSFTDDIQGFIEQVKLIQSNPKLYFVDSLTMGDAICAFEEHSDGDEKYYTGYQVKKEYDEETKRWDKVSRDTTITQDQFVTDQYNEFYQEKVQRDKNIEHDKQYAFTFFESLFKEFEEIDAVGVMDKNKDGFICTPRYIVDVVISKELSYEELEMLANQIDDYTREKNYSGDRKTLEHQFEFEGAYYELQDIATYDYKYYK